MIRSTMQEFPLTVPAITRHGTSVYGASECVTWTGAAPRRASYAQVGQNAGRLARALARLGIRPNDPVATFCWNNQEHPEAYFEVPGKFDKKVLRTRDAAGDLALERVSR